MILTGSGCLNNLYYIRTEFPSLQPGETKATENIPLVLFSIYMSFILFLQQQKARCLRIPRLIFTAPQGLSRNTPASFFVDMLCCCWRSDFSFFPLSGSACVFASYSSVCAFFSTSALIGLVTCYKAVLSIKSIVFFLFNTVMLLFYY